jgi:hypothetical protein
MNSIDITQYIVGDSNQLIDIKEWLVDNIGPLTQPIPTCRTGEGWTIKYESAVDEKHNAPVYKLKIEFEDDSHAVMFRLVWP